METCFSEEVSSCQGLKPEQNFRLVHFRVARCEPFSRRKNLQVLKITTSDSALSDCRSIVLGLAVQGWPCALTLYRVKRGNPKLTSQSPPADLPVFLVPAAGSFHKRNLESVLEQVLGNSLVV